MNATLPVVPTPIPAMTDLVFAVTLALLLMAPLAIAGVALINTGLGRSRSAAQALLGNLAMVAVATTVFALFGAVLAGGLSGAGHVFHLAGKPWDWAGTGRLMLRGFSAAPAETQLELLFEFLAVALAALIPWGSGADRWRLTAGCASAAVFAGIVFPLTAHWIWGGGWLAQLSANFGLGAGFLDGGGAATVHVAGGMSALAVVWIAGPRKGSSPRRGFRPRCRATMRAMFCLAAWCA